MEVFRKLLSPEQDQGCPEHGHVPQCLALSRHTAKLSSRMMPDASFVLSPLQMRRLRPGVPRSIYLQIVGVSAGNKCVGRERL